MRQCPDEVALRRLRGSARCSLCATDHAGARTSFLTFVVLRPERRPILTRSSVEYSDHRTGRPCRELQDDRERAGLVLLGWPQRTAAPQSGGFAFPPGRTSLCETMPDPRKRIELTTRTRDGVRHPDSTGRMTDQELLGWHAGLPLVKVNVKSLQHGEGCFHLRRGHTILPLVHQPSAAFLEE